MIKIWTFFIFFYSFLLKAPSFCYIFFLFIFCFCRSQIYRCRLFPGSVFVCCSCSCSVMKHAWSLCIQSLCGSVLSCASFWTLFCQSRDWESVISITYFPYCVVWSFLGSISFLFFLWFKSCLCEEILTKTTKMGIDNNLGKVSLWYKFSMTLSKTLGSLLFVFIWKEIYFVKSCLMKMFWSLGLRFLFKWNEDYPLPCLFIYLIFVFSFVC